MSFGELQSYVLEKIWGDKPVINKEDCKKNLRTASSLLFYSFQFCKDEALAVQIINSPLKFNAAEGNLVLKRISYEYYQYKHLFKDIIAKIKVPTEQQQLVIDVIQGTYNPAEFCEVHRVEINSNLPPLIFVASAFGHEKIVSGLLAKGVNADTVYEKSSFKETCLLISAKNGHAEVITVLAEEGASLTRTNTIQLSPLEMACIHDHLECIQAIDDAYTQGVVNFDAINESYKYTPLMFAARNDSAKAIQKLGELGVDLNIRGSKKRDALMVAVAENKQKAVKALLDVGADVTNRDKLGRSALMIASGVGDIELLELLFKNPKSATYREDNNGDTGLKIAARAGNVEAVNWWLSNGSVANWSGNNSKVTPIMCAAQSGSPETVEVLIKQGAETTRLTEDDDTALIIAAHQEYQCVEGRNYAKTMQLLLDNGAKEQINHRNKKGDTALLAAMKSFPSPEVVKVLLEAGADVRMLDKRHQSVFTFATKGLNEPNAEVIKLLLEYLYKQTMAELSNNRHKNAKLLLSLERQFDNQKQIVGSDKDLLSLWEKVQKIRSKNSIALNLESMVSGLKLSRSRDSIKRAAINFYNALCEEPNMTMNAIEENDYLNKLWSDHSIYALLFTAIETEQHELHDIFLKLSVEKLLMKGDASNKFNKTNNVEIAMLVAVHVFDDALRNELLTQVFTQVLQGELKGRVSLSRAIFKNSAFLYNYIEGAVGSHTEKTLKYVSEQSQELVSQKLKSFCDKAIIEHKDNEIEELKVQLKAEREDKGQKQFVAFARQRAKSCEAIFQLPGDNEEEENKEYIY